MSGGVPEAPRLELMEQDSKDSAQSSSTTSSSEIQPEYNVGSFLKHLLQEKLKRRTFQRRSEKKNQSSSVGSFGLQATR